MTRLPITRLPDYPISPPSDPSFVFQFEEIGGVKIEGRRAAFVFAAELGVTAVADGEVLQSAIHDEIDERRRPENAVRDQIAAEPVEARADERADDDDGEADLGIEVLADVEIGAGTDRTAIDGGVGAHRLADRQRDFTAAAAAFDRRRRILRVNRQTRIAFRTLREDLH